MKVTLKFTITIVSLLLFIDSRTFGHEAKMSPNRDDTIHNAILLTDPSHGSMSDGLITGWRLFVKILSVRHEVFLQIWRRRRPPHGGATTNADDVNMYTLVGQTFIRPTELRYTEYPLETNQLLRIRAGDVLGLYFPDLNPIGWSSVPCAFREQRYMFVTNPSKVAVGSSFRFETAPPGDDSCRQYSFLAVFGQ